MSGLIPAGFLQNPEVTNALLLGSVIAAVSGAVGTFIVLRAQSFVGHILTDVGAAGAAGSFLIGLNAWYGFLSFGLLAGLGVESLGERARDRDVATGIVLSLAMGLGALFLFLDVTLTQHANASMLVLFGSIFVVNPAMTPLVAASGVVALGVLAFLYRPLLWCSVSPQTAAARGVSVRWVSFGFMMLTAIAVEDGALAVGALLSTALLIGPAAATIPLTTRPGAAVISAALVGVAVTWLGIFLAYDSYYWPPAGRGWPVSFFIAILMLIVYLGSQGFARRAQGGRS